MSSRSEHPRRPQGWNAPGPKPAGAGIDPELQPETDEDLSYLAGDWRLFQPKSGHRWSLDDLVTAYVAVEAMRGEEGFFAVDLGCGLGSVLMLVAWAFPTLQVTGVEAQAARARRARRSLRFNGAADRCAVVDGDLRDVAGLLQAVTGKPRLITGTPPYFEPTATNLSHDAEAAACRAEIRGGLEVYLDAGVALLADDGVLVLCYPDTSAERARVAGQERGLHLRSRLRVVPAAGKPPLIVVDCFARGAATDQRATEAELTVRGADGQWTEAFRAVRRRFGMPERPPARVERDV